MNSCLPDFVERWNDAMDLPTFAEQYPLVIKLYKDAAAAFAAMPDRDKHLITEKHWMWDL